MKKYRVMKGNESIELPWLVRETGSDPDPCAEFLYRSDARKFCKMKNEEDK